MNEELKVIIKAEIANLKKNMQEAKNEMSEFRQQYQNASKDVDKSLKTVGEAGKTAMKAVTVAIAGTISSLVALGASTKEYRENIAKLNSAFESAGGSAETAKGVYNDLYRVLGESDVAVEASNHLAKLTMNQKELSEWTNICKGVYATFGDSIPIEGLTEASNETAKVGQVTGTLADALNWANINEDKFNESLAKCNSESEREKLIRETLTSIYSQAAEAYEVNNAQVLAQNEAQARLQETTAQLGATMAPVVTAFIDFANKALGVIVPYVEPLGNKLIPKLTMVLDEVAEALEKTMGFLEEHWGLVLSVAGVITGITTAIGLYNTVSAVKNAMDIAQVTTLKALITSYLAQGAAMLTAIAPYALVVAGITAVIAIIVLCIKHWDQIKETVSRTWSNIKEATSNAVESVKNKFNEMKNNAINAIASMKQGVVNKFNEIKAGITEKINGARNAVKSAIDKIKSIMNFSWSLPKLKLPTISIKGKFSLSPLSVPKFSITWNELGGVFDKPHVFSYGNSLQGLGENGAEAVVPLEKNTQWLDKIAERLSAKQNGIPIVLQVDGKTFAQASIDSINQLTRQTGNLGLRLV